MPSLAVSQAAASCGHANSSMFGRGATASCHCNHHDHFTPRCACAHGVKTEGLVAQKLKRFSPLTVRPLQFNFLFLIQFIIKTNAGGR